MAIGAVINESDFVLAELKKIYFEGLVTGRERLLLLHFIVKGLDLGAARKKRATE